MAKQEMTMGDFDAWTRERGVQVTIMKEARQDLWTVTFVELRPRSTPSTAYLQPLARACVVTAQTISVAVARAVDRAEREWFSGAEVRRG